MSGTDDKRARAAPEGGESVASILTAAEVGTILHDRARDQELARREEERLRTTARMAAERRILDAEDVVAIAAAAIRHATEVSESADTFFAPFLVYAKNVPVVTRHLIESGFSGITQSDFEVDPTPFGRVASDQRVALYDDSPKEALFLTKSERDYIVPKEHASGFGDSDEMRLRLALVVAVFPGAKIVLRAEVVRDKTNHGWIGLQRCDYLVVRAEKREVALRTDWPKRAERV